MNYERYAIGDLKFWRVTAGLALTSFFIFASLYTVHPLLPVFVNEFGISTTTSSLSLSLTVVSLVIGLVVLGFLSDRTGRVLFIKFSLLSSILPFILIPMTDSFIIVLLLRFLQGFALAGLPAAAVAYIGEEVDKRSASIAIVLYISSNALGGMVGRGLTGYIADHYSWRVSFYFFACLGLLIFAIVFFMLPRSRYFEASGQSFLEDLSSLQAHLKNRTLVFAFVLGIVLQFSFTGIWTYIPFYLQDPPFLLSIKEISYIYITYMFGIIGAPLAGGFIGKWGGKRVTAFGVLVLCLGILLTAVPSLVFVIAGLSCVCFGFFTAHAMAAAWVGEKAEHHKGSASSLYLVSYYLGVAIGGTALGPLWDIFGWIGVVILTVLLPLIYGGIWMKSKQE